MQFIGKSDWDYEMFMNSYETFMKYYLFEKHTFSLKIIKYYVCDLAGPKRFSTNFLDFNAQISKIQFVGDG